MLKTFKVLFLSLITITFITGCTQRVTDFTVISTKNVDLNSKSLKRASERVRGEDPAYMIIIFPTGTTHLKQAIDNAIEKVPGAVALADGVVSFTSFYIPLIFGKTTYVVEGTPLIDQNLVSSLPSNYIISTYNNELKDFETKYVSKEEFELYKSKLKS
ncbi:MULTISPECIES: hypothetical protein [Arcobacteraceae]|uniref:Lipoprotein n=1 Tax=Aliarcobacter thereius LMG 24486 TaxID=1032240 RepID=A0A1C7WQ47_9BACT|nr:MULTISPECIES: hypothetical protein [Arcobacteraceae]OCL84083.1 hypothetical protein AAW30_00456 [Arcobacter porcinus]OCL94857.1 hypothetical protein AA347_00301 [Aliarcobacter thereius LMG 24486]QBF15269.1 putative membrane protein [Aliarcobacter thereius LMG 24486]TLS92008.1 hypothetical protein FE244_07735 [Aliarcobacter thereius]TLT07854.1 hypothetical protein FE243_03710 [Aliarcobacter thereius]